ncbi:unnamed protein product, partial [Phaeothamnion confervicola]
GGGGSSGNGGGYGGGSPVDSGDVAPEDGVELLCGGVVLDPGLSMGAVNHYIWKRPGTTIPLHFRTKRRKSLHCTSSATA